MREPAFQCLLEINLTNGPEVETTGLAGIGNRLI